MQLVDTHCHLYLDAFRADIGSVISRSLNAGVNRLYLPAIDRGEHEHMLALEQEYPGQCRAMMGLHPCSVKADYRDELEAVRGWLDKRPFAAVGEIGLDYFWDKTFIREQQEAFRQQLEWSVEFGLPVVIHSRNAVDDCLRILETFPKGQARGIFHCFSDDLPTAHRILDLGFYLGIGGVVTYKKSGLDAVVRELPLESMVLETDAPYLTPVPFRGKRNESSYLVYVARKLAEAKACPVELVAEVTSANAQKIFGSW